MLSNNYLNKTFSVPPSFSFATNSSQHHLESLPTSQHVSRQQINIKLPQFPGYNTFTSSAQARNLFNNSATNLNCYNSHGSLDSNETGRSLDTLDSGWDIVNSEYENVIEVEHNF